MPSDTNSLSWTGFFLKRIRTFGRRNSISRICSRKLFNKIRHRNLNFLSHRCAISSCCWSQLKYCEEVCAQVNFLKLENTSREPRRSRFLNFFHRKSQRKNWGTNHKIVLTRSESRSYAYAKFWKLAALHAEAKDLQHDTFDQIFQN